MKITENNCEEYFLLYIDAELTSLERNAVEAFMADYPQKAALLESLLQAKLSTNESIAFTQKNLLYKAEDSEIGIDNYEEYFLLYTDDELSEDEKESTERFVLQHPKLQAEFTLLQQTKLPIEKIEFAGKEKLYKKEKERRLIPFYFPRIAVAAAMVMLVTLGWQLSSHKNSSTATLEKSTHARKPIIAPATKAELPKETVNPTQEQAGVQSKGDKHEVKISLNVSDKKKQFAAITNDRNKGEKTPDVSVEQPVQYIVLTAPPATETVIQKQPSIEKIKQAEVLKPLEEADTDETNTQAASTLLSDNNIAQPAVYKELNTDEDNHTVYVGAFQLNKTKINGFLKSASHLLGSRTKGTSE